MKKPFSRFWLVQSRPARVKTLDLVHVVNIAVYVAVRWSLCKLLKIKTRVNVVHVVQYPLLAGDRQSLERASTGSECRRTCSCILCCPMTLKPLRALLIAGLSLIAAQLAVAADSPAEAARKWRTAHENEILKEFTSLLAIPNVAS